MLVKVKFAEKFKKSSMCSERFCEIFFSKVDIEIEKTSLEIDLTIRTLKCSEPDERADGKCGKF